MRHGSSTKTLAVLSIAKIWRKDQSRGKPEHVPTGQEQDDGPTLGARIFRIRAAAPRQCAVLRSTRTPGRNRSARCCDIPDQQEDTALDAPFTPFDLQRMFLGDQPWLFYLEIVVRTVLVYGYALLLIRWFGGRGIAQLSLVEFLLVIALGSAVGDAPFYPDVPLLHAFAVITIVMMLNWLMDLFVARHPRAEQVIIGAPHKLIENGVIDSAMMDRLKLGQSELFQGARRAGIENLGEVRAGYLEPSGQFSFFLHARPEPGLPIEPPWAIDPPPCIGPGEMVQQPPAMLCTSCALPLESSAKETPGVCPACSGRKWTKAVGGVLRDESGG